MTMLVRAPENPLITPADVPPSRSDMEVICAFNAGAAVIQGRTVLLLRVAERPIPQPGYLSTAVLDPDDPAQLDFLHFRLDDPDLNAFDKRVLSYKGQVYLTSIGHLRAAFSDDGVHFSIAAAPALYPQTPYETFGIEDARITCLEGWYYVNYSAVSARGVCTALARTTDFITFERLGVIFAPDNKDVAIFPEKIGGRYYAFHRPSAQQIAPPSIWLASSANLLDWGSHRYVIGPRPAMWDSERVGSGAPPIKTAHGWLELYHASDTTTWYRHGALLLDLDDPARVLARSNRPFFSPEADYELSGFMDHIVFSNGLVLRGDGKADLYYGAGDWVTCLARIDVDAILSHLVDK